MRRFAEAPASAPQSNNAKNASSNATNGASSQAGSWFFKFAPFIYDPTAGLRSNFDRLATLRNWSKKKRQNHWTECQEEEFGYAFGTDTTKLESWQDLCREIRIKNPPDSIKGCKKVSSTIGLTIRTMWLKPVSYSYLVAPRSWLIWSI